MSFYCKQILKFFHSLASYDTILAILIIFMTVPTHITKCIMLHCSVIVIWCIVYYSLQNPSRIERDTCTPTFIAALFTMARTWKQPRCPSADDWIRNLWYICIREYYSAIKKKEHIWVSSNEVDETRAYCTEGSNPEREPPIQYINAYTWNLERR